MESSVVSKTEIEKLTSCRRIHTTQYACTQVPFIAACESTHSSQIQMLNTCAYVNINFFGGLTFNVKKLMLKFEHL